MGLSETRETQITAAVLRPVPKERWVEPAPPFQAHLIRPHAEASAPPAFTIAPDVSPQVPAPLPASAARSSPLQGGSAGIGPADQQDSSNGTGGIGKSLAGCLDPVWQRALADRVRKFFYWPDIAVRSHMAGVVMIHIIVHRDGHLSALDIAGSSGEKALDQAAYNIVHAAQPLPPLPERMHVEQLDGEVAINFGVRDFHASVAMGHCD